MISCLHKQNHQPLTQVSTALGPTSISIFKDQSREGTIIAQTQAAFAYRFEASASYFSCLARIAQIMRAYLLAMTGPENSDHCE